MAVYERTYRGYDGALTPERGRFLILTRYAYSQVFSSRFFIAYFALCFLVPIAGAFSLWGIHNLETIGEKLGFDASQIGVYSPGGAELLTFLFLQGVIFGFPLALVVGPTLISSDMRDNGLSLYLSRPFSRTEYIFGKLAVLAILLSAITWAPGLFLFTMQGWFGGREWLSSHWTLGPGLVLAAGIWILVLSLIALSISALVKMRTFARAALFGIFIVSGGVANAINGMWHTQWGSLFNVAELMRTAWVSVLGLEIETSLPAPVAWTALVVLCAACTWLLYRRVRAYEVVR